MNLSYIILAAWCWQIFCLKDRSVDEFAPVLSHFFFVDDSKIFADKFGIDGDNFDQFVPKTENLGAHYVDIIDKLIR